MSQARLNDPAPVRIEAANEWAWCGDRRLDLTPKAFAVLRHLASNSGRLVTKTELLDTIWGDTIVSEAALTSCIRDLRRALGDASRAPRYLETVHRRGFRFIGPLDSPQRSGGAVRATAAATPPAFRHSTHEPSDRAAARPQLVGRESDLARLHGLFAAARDGRRRVVFVTGEAGIGKTTLVEAFLAELEPIDALRVGRGQCVEQYGAGEAYLPVLEALGRMGRDPGGDALVATLRRYAPTWLAELPALLTDEDLDAVQRRTQGSTRERMLRELIEALDAISSETPLVLLLEDLHWSDSATVDILAMLARRRDPARLLIVGTYRPADVAAAAHPLQSVKQDLQLHGHCEELTLEFLSEAAVGEYVARRLPGESIPSRLAQVLHRNTSGNPLFLVNLIDHLVARGHVREVDQGWELAVGLADVASDVPNTLWQMVDDQIGRLTPSEQAVLAVGSVAGAEFSAALASVDGIDPDDAERSCAALTRRGQFLRALGAEEWPDGTVAGRYGFIHALYRSVLYARVPIGHRVGLHLRIGDRLERAHDARAGELAGELAMHFEEGRDFERAVKYRRQAANNALRHHGHREAVSHATRSLDLLAALPESPERLQQELAIRTTLGAAMVPQGSAAPEISTVYAQARELCKRVGVTPELFPALVGLSGYYLTRADLRTARDVADQFLTLADATEDAAIFLGAHNAAGMVSFYAGDFADALDHLEKGLTVYDPQRHGPGHWPAFWGGHDPGVSCAAYCAWALWALGYPVRAEARMQQALDWARSAAYPFTLANARSIAAVFHVCRRDVDLARVLIDDAVVQAREHGFEMLADLNEVLRGWLLCRTGERKQGAAHIQSSVDTFRGKGVGIGLPTFLGLLAEADLECARAEEGIAAVADALAMSEATGVHYWDAELRRLSGMLLLSTAASQHRSARRRGSSPAEKNAESCFSSAIEIARRQQAKSLELRAVTSLCQLWQSQGRIYDARALLSEIYAWFVEGFQTADLTAAKALLEQLEGAERS